ncbi:olfactomedin-like protein 2B [Anguilla anguilla]|uniref:olfactomedin-like protein 2B n=1 Tax=Anguilla anguilla TaxID=7936 RepID=UPI0015B3108A|nr:olfactomedin-like protein 2B [Anguilla anguilla]
MSKLVLVCVIWCLVLGCSSAAPNEVAGNKLNDATPQLDSELHGQYETLEDEMDNQENIMTQLLGDYDKVKALSEGSDCRCKCVVRPLSRSACRRIEEDSAKAQDFYTVETVTSGSDCKCACIAPPSALNPCEGDFRFKKLQDAGKDEIKMSTIMDLLEGALYGMDLLKLHSVTTKLLNRVENIEKAVSQNHTEQRVSGSQEQVQTQQKESRINLQPDKRKRMPGPPLQRDAAATDTEPKKKHEEKWARGLSRPLLKRSHPERGTEGELTEQESKKQAQARPGSNGMVIRGITYYKSSAMEDKDMEDHPAVATVEEVLSGDGSVDLVLEDLLLKRKHTAPKANEKERVEPNQPAVAAATADGGKTSGTGSALPTRIPNGPSKLQSTALTLTAPMESAAGDMFTTTTPPATTTTAPPPTTTAAVATATTESVTLTPLTASPTTTTPRVSTTRATKAAAPVKPKYRISWTESPTEETMSMEPPKNPGECKDTLASVSDPVTHNTYGKPEGAWMKDPKSAENKVYVTNYYFGNNMLEFHDMETFKKGQPSNSYKLPYNWIGTGHVVYNGAFFYNRAYSRDIIKFDLKLRYVAAWTMLHDAAFEEDTPWQWRGHSDIDFAVDESGLWIIYPALDEEAFHQEVIVLSKLNPTDLSIQKETTWRTRLRRNFYGNCFVVCGVLYAIDSYDRTRANISYAFDTHTNTQMIPRLPFANSYSHNTQVDYNPKERVLYAWDNGHQVTYNLVFAY